MYDLIIIGAGPAGLTASIYASCFCLKHIVIGKILGGQMSLAHTILNYPGFESIAGIELTKKMTSQVKARGGEIICDSVVRITKKRQGFELTTEGGKTYETKTIILATGTERRKLNVKGESEYTGKGVSYCTTCDSFDVKDKVCAIVGGANSAASSAIAVSQKAAKVYLIYRGKELRCDPIWLKQVKANPKIEVIYQGIVSEILGDGQKATGVIVKSMIDQSTKTLTIYKIFIEIGGVPGAALLIPLGVEMDQGGYIKVDEKLAANIPGIFAAGDVVSSKLSIEQISSAVGLGARAATSCFAFLKGQNPPSLWGESQIKRIPNSPCVTEVSRVHMLAGSLNERSNGSNTKL